MKKKVEPLRHNGKLYGAFVTQPNGLRYYLAFRKHAEIFRGGCKSISDAISAGLASWALDVTTLGEIRTRGIDLIGFEVKETKDIWFTHTDNYYDPHKYTSHNYARRGGAFQRYLPLQHFRVRHGKIRL
jgi:hypothetical protein